MDAGTNIIRKAELLARLGEGRALRHHPTPGMEPTQLSGNRLAASQKLNRPRVTQQPHS